jgi:putative peptidoglycan lipid II flippase
MPDDTREERARLVTRAGVVGSGTLLARVLGLGRDAVIAALFDRAQTDAFFVAFTIPNALRQLLGEGAVSSAVVPILGSKLATDGDAAAKAFYARARAVSLLVLAIISVLGVVFAGPITSLFVAAPQAETFSRTRDLTAAVFPYVFFMGTAALGAAALNAKHRFAVAAFAPGLLNVGIIVAAIVLRAPLEARGIDGAIALCIGVVAGGALQTAAQLPALRALGWLGRPILDLRDPGVRDMLRRILPMTIGIGIYYIDLVVSRRLLSGLGEGPQSWFSWAMRVCDFPQGIFVMAISTAALPSLSALAATRDRSGLASVYAHGMRLSMFVAIPASVGLVVLREPVITMLFKRGAFDDVAVRETARALEWQGGAIFLVAAARLLVPALYALGDTRTPVLVSALDSIAFVGLAIGLRGPFGHVGVSMAVLGSTAVQVALLFAAVRMRLGTMCAREIGIACLRVLAAAAPAAAIARASTSLVPPALSCMIFVGLFFCGARVLRCPELDDLYAPLRKRLLH